MRLISIPILFFYFSFSFGQLEGYQFIDSDQFIIIDDSNRISFKLNLTDGMDGISGFKIAGSGEYQINKSHRKLKVFIENSIDSIESKYELVESVGSDATSIELMVYNDDGTPARAINTCYVIDNKTFGTITGENGKACLEFNNGIIPENIKVYSLLHIPVYIPVKEFKSSLYYVYLIDESVIFFIGGVIELEVCLNSELKEIKLESVEILKKPVNICL